jgi:hypothetical protein
LASGKWGELLAENGKPTVALIVVSQSVDQFRTLSGEKDNAHAQADMATALECQSAVYSQIGQTDPGLKAACAALAIRTELAKKAGDTKAALRDRANSMILVADTHAARCEFVRAREHYKSARELVIADPNDALSSATARSADEKLELLKAVEAVSKDPVKGLAGVAQNLRLPALRTATDWLMKGNNAVLAAAIASQLTAIAPTPEDFYIEAKALAQCAASSNPKMTQTARDEYKLDAIKALDSARAAGFRDAELLDDPNWDTFRTVAAFQTVQESIATSKPLAPRPRAMDRI